MKTLLERISRAYNRTPEPDDDTVKHEEDQRRAAMLDRYRDTLAQAHATGAMSDTMSTSLASQLNDLGIGPLHLRDHWRILTAGYAPDYIRLYPDNDWSPPEQPGRPELPPEFFATINAEHEAQRMARIRAAEDRLNELRQALALAVAGPKTTDEEITALVAMMRANGKWLRDVEPAITYLARGVPMDQLWIYDQISPRGGLPL